MASIVLQKTFGSRQDIKVFDDDVVMVDDVLAPDAIVTHYEGEVRVALNPVEPTLLEVGDVPYIARIHIKREEGWQEHLGWKALLLDYVEGALPDNIALAVYTNPEADGYLFTTGKFQWFEEDQMYGCVCPPGYEPEHDTVNFSMLLGSNKYSVFSLWDNLDEITVDTGGDI